MMGAKVYVLLDIMGGSSEQVAGTLRGKPGVVMVDALAVVIPLTASEQGASLILGIDKDSHAS